jgi:hypothetical protein
MPGSILNACRNLAERIDDGLQRRRMSAEERARNVILTGFPRSGTSLFSALLGEIDNAVCLNEISPTPWHFHFFGRVRRRIEEGRPIPNQYEASGELTTNTRGARVRTETRVVTVRDRKNFVLAQKYTLPYLNRLEQLCEEGWRVWVLVRDPRFALGSWRTCPAHWGISRLVPPDVLLAHIPFTTDDPDRRRVEVWNHYARVIDSLRGRLEIVRYEDLVADPIAVMGRFCQAHGLELPSDFAPELRSKNQPSIYGPEGEVLERLAAESCELGLFGYR